MRRCFVLAAVVVCLASLAPTLALADGEDYALSAAPESAIEETVPPAVEPSASVELSIGVSPSVGFAGLGGLAGLAGNVFVPGIMPTFDLAIALERRVWLVLGGAFSIMANDAVTYSGVSVPLLVQVYLDEPCVGAVVPTLRVGVVGSYSDYGQVMLGLRGRVSGGLTWLASRWIALRLEVGGAVGGYASAGEAVWSGSLDAQGSLVMRL